MCPALNGSDYDAVSMEITLTPDMPMGCIQVNIIADRLPEGVETFVVHLAIYYEDQVNLNPDYIYVIIIIEGKYVIV